jgi:hypothetical protein
METIQLKQADALLEEPKEDTDEGWYLRFLEYLRWKRNLIP